MRTGSSLELQIQGARTGAPSRDDAARSVGGNGARRSAGLQLGTLERSGHQQQVSPYLNSLSYHELVGGRRSTSTTSGKNLAAGASAAVQEAHQRLERLLGPQQPATGSVGVIKRPSSAPFTFSAPIHATTAGSGSGGGGSANANVLSASISGTAYSSSSVAANSRPRPASASPLQTSAKGALSGGASLLSTAPPAIAVSSSTAASNQRISPGRTLSAPEPNHGMPASVGVTGVISSGHNSAVVSVSESTGGVVAAKGRLRSPTGGTKEVLGIGGQGLLGPGGVLLDGSASMPALMPSSLDASSSLGSGAGAASGRRPSGASLSAALTASPSERVVGSSGGRSAGPSALRGASPSSGSPKSGAGSASGSGSHGSVSGAHGAFKSHPQSRRRVRGSELTGGVGGASGLPAACADGASGRAGTAAVGTGTATLKVGQVVNTTRGGNNRGGTGSHSEHRSGGDGMRVRTTAASSDRPQMGPRSPASPSGHAVGGVVAKTTAGRSSVNGTGANSGRAAAPGSGTKAVSGRRASTTHQDTGITTAAPSLGDEFVLTGTQGVKASSLATGGGNTSSTSGGRPSSSERRRRSSSNTAIATPITANRPCAETAQDGSGAGYNSGVGVLRGSAARQATSSLPVSLTGTSGAATHSGTGQRVKPPSIDLSALSSGPRASAPQDMTPVMSRNVTEPGRGSNAGRRIGGAEFSGSLETRLGPPMSPTTSGSPLGTCRYTVGLDDPAAPPPLLLLPTRSPLQSPRSSLGLPRRSRGSLGFGSGGALTSSFNGLSLACRWARNAPLPTDACEEPEMPASAIVMHDLQVSAHTLVLQVGAGTSSFIEALRERYVEAYRASRKGH